MLFFNGIKAELKYNVVIISISGRHTKIKIMFFTTLEKFEADFINAILF